MNIFPHSKRYRAFLNNNMRGDVYYRRISKSSYDKTYAIYDEEKARYALKIIPIWNSKAYDFYVNVRSKYIPTVVYYDTLATGYSVITEWINGKYPEMDYNKSKQWKNIGTAYAKFQKIIGSISYGHELNTTNLRDQCYVVSQYMGKLKYSDCVNNIDTSLINYIDHGDLNIHNILIDINGKVFFIDLSSVINRSSLCGLCLLKNSIHMNSKSINRARSLWLTFLKSYLSEFNYKYIKYFDELVDASAISVAYMYILAETNYCLSKGYFVNEITYWCDRYQTIIEENKSNNKLQQADNPLVLY